MDEVVQHAVVTAFTALPEGCRHNAATEEQLRDFEREFGQVPPDLRWFLKTCGGGVVGSEWVDDIVRLIATHRKFRLESGQGGWTMRNVFVIGWDGFGNPFGIELTTGQVVVEDHDFGGVHRDGPILRVISSPGFRSDVVMFEVIPLRFQVLECETPRWLATPIIDTQVIYRLKPDGAGARDFFEHRIT